MGVPSFPWTPGSTGLLWVYSRNPTWALRCRAFRDIASEVGRCPAWHGSDTHQGAGGVWILKQSTYIRWSWKTTWHFFIALTYLRGLCFAHDLDFGLNQIGFKYCGIRQLTLWFSVQVLQLEETSAWVQGNGSDGEKQFVDFDFAVLAMGSQYAGTELWKAQRFHAISTVFLLFIESYGP